MTPPELKFNPYESLCYYDKRNPDYDPDNGERSENCYCDTCFYGKHNMANELIKLLDFIEAIPGTK